MIVGLFICIVLLGVVLLVALHIDELLVEIIMELRRIKNDIERRQ